MDDPSGVNTKEGSHNRETQPVTDPDPPNGFSRILSISTGIAFVILGVFSIIANSGGSYAVSLTIGFITAAMGFLAPLLRGTLPRIPRIQGQTCPSDVPIREPFFG